MTVLHPKDCIATEKIQADIHVRDDSICYNLARPRDFYIYIYILAEGHLPSRFLSKKRGGRREDHSRFAFETCNFRRFRPLFSRSRISPPDSIILPSLDSRFRVKVHAHPALTSG